jgi:uncharacterized integral membrane protein (TIGR00698 family)
MLHGVLLIALFACAAFYIGGMDCVKALSFSPMVVGIIIGMLYANSLRNNLPDTWVPGIKFCSKRILRTGIILYGFKLTFQDVMAVGFSAIVMDAIIVCGTIGLGILVGRLLKIDRSIALLTACGSAICGAAAVLGVDGAAYDDGIHYDGREAYSHHILEGELETIKDDACAEDSLAAKLDARYPGVRQVVT